DLRAHLAKTLPSYMVPSLFVQLDTLPLSTSGKLDKRALPAPEQTGLGEHVPATTPTQIALADIWRSLLQIEEVGITDNFFALGGHSLLVMRVLAQITKEFNTTLSVAQVFVAPTIEGLAHFISDNRRKEVEQAIQLVPRTGDLPLSYAQQ